jgi:hypothetical protein
VIAANGATVAIAREADGERALLAVNAGRDGARLEVPDPAAVDGLQPLELPVVSAGRLVDGRVLELPPQSALVLV